MEDSLSIKHFRAVRYTVLTTHICNGQNFLIMETPDCDYIIGDPPYSLKSDVIGRLLEIDKPFVMLVDVVGLSESQHRFSLFRSHEFEIMYLNKHVSYFKDYTEQKPSLNPPLSGVYICSKMLPGTIVFEEIDK